MLTSGHEVAVALTNPQTWVPAYTGPIQDPDTQSSSMEEGGASEASPLSDELLAVDNH